MDNSELPPFRQTGLFKEWLKAIAMFPQISEEQKANTLAMAYAIYERVKKRAQGSDPVDWPGR